MLVMSCNIWCSSFNITAQEQPICVTDFGIIFQLQQENIYIHRFEGNIVGRKGYLFDSVTIFYFS